MRTALIGAAMLLVGACAESEDHNGGAEASPEIPGAHQPVDGDQAKDPRDLPRGPGAEPAAPAKPAEPTAPVHCGEPQVVQLKTSDGVTLAADYTPPSAPGRGAALLFHMIPPSNDRKGYPPRVREALAKIGIAVLNVDRRGAGASGGTAKDAYKGPGGALDVAAAVAFITDKARACPADPSKLLLVGASNGTTSILDYTVAPPNPGLPASAALVFLSPGKYTESQHKIADHRTRLDALPIYWFFPSSEPYSKAFATGAPKTWRFHEQSPGAHGTRLFDEGPMEAAVLPKLSEFAQATLAR